MSLIITKNFKREKAQDSARNVKYRGCEITVAYHNPDNVNLPGKTWIVKDVDGVSVGGFSSEAKAKAWIDAHPSRTADSRAMARNAASDELNVGDKIWITQYGRNYPYTITKKWKEGWTVWYKAKNDKSGKEETVAGAFANALDAAELNSDADLRAALSKMADIAKRLTDAKVSFKAGWTPDGIGEIILEFPDIESARKYNYYKLFNAWEAARSQIVPRWAVNIGGYRVPRIEGNRMTISILHFST